MPTFEITAPNGRTIEVDGDHTPNQEELDGILRAAGMKAPRMEDEPYFQRLAKRGDVSPEQLQSLYEDYKQSFEKYGSKEKPSLAKRAWVDARESFFSNTLAGVASDEEMQGRWKGPSVISTYDALSPKGPAPRAERTPEQKFQALRDATKRYGEYAGLPDSRGIIEKTVALTATVAGNLPTPETFVGGPGKGTVIRKIAQAGLENAATNIVTSPIIQSAAVDMGRQDEVSLRQVLVDGGLGFLGGGLMRGAGEAASRGLSKLLERFRADPALLQRVKTEVAKIETEVPPEGRDAARAEYIKWWEDELAREDAIRQGPGGREGLRQDLAATEVQQTRAVASDLEATLKANQVGMPESSPVPRDPAMDRQMAELDLRKDVSAPMSKEDRLLADYQRRTGRNLESGRIDLGLLANLGGGAAGGAGGFAYGLTQGETPEERMANAFKYAAMGGALGLAGGKGLRMAASGNGGKSGITPFMPELPRWLVELPGKVKSELRTRGNLTKFQFDAKERTAGAKAADAAEMGNILNRFAKAGGDKADQKIVGAALAGDATAMGMLPTELADVVTDMKVQKQRLGDEINNVLLAELNDPATKPNSARAIALAKLITTIQDNRENYLHRSYKAFDDQRYVAEVKNGQHVAGSTFDQARQHVKSVMGPAFAKEGAEKGLTGRALDDYIYERSTGEVNKILDDTQANVERLMSGQDPDMSPMMKRGDIDPAIRNLLGEYTDPVVNYTKSIAKMSSYLHGRKQLLEIKADGLAKGYITERPAGLNTTKVLGKLGQDFYAKPEIAAVLNSMDELDPVKNPAMRFFMKAAGLAQASKVITNNVAAMRNIQSSALLVLAQGHFNPAGLAHSKAIAKAVFGDITRNWSKSSLARFQRYAELGLVDGNMDISMLRDIVKDAVGKDLDQMLYHATTKAGKLVKAGATVGRAYQAVDNFARILSYEMELDRYSKALGVPRTDPGLQARAAEIAKNTYPNYARVPKAVKRLRRVPIGNFMSWPAEIIRTTVNTAAQAASEIKDPALRSIGVKRATGLLAVLGAGYVAQDVARRATGVSEEELKASREFMPPWSQNSDVVTWKDKDGRVNYVDISYSMPYSYLTKVVTTMLTNPSGADNAIVEGLKELASPFVDERMLAGKLLDVARNKTDRGATVWNPQDTAGNKAAAIASHIGGAFTPGAFDSAMRLYKAYAGERGDYGREYSPSVETLAQAGFRAQTIDKVQAVQFAASRSMGQSNLDSQLFTQRVRKDPNMSTDDMVAAYVAANESRYKTWSDLAQKAQAARVLGASKSQVFRALREGGLSNENARLVLAGKFEPMWPSKDWWKDTFAGRKMPDRVALLKARRELGRKALQTN